MDRLEHDILEYFLTRGVEKADFTPVPLYVLDSNKRVEKDIQLALTKLRVILRSLSSKCSLFPPHLSIFDWLPDNCDALRDVISSVGKAHSRMESGRLSHARMVEFDEIRNQQLMEVAVNQGSTLAVGHNPNIPYENQPPITKYFKTRQKTKGLRVREPSSSEGASSGSKQSRDSLKRAAARSPSRKRANEKLAPVAFHTSTKCENASLVALLVPSPIIKPSDALSEVLNMPSTLDKAAIGTPSLYVSEGPDSVFLVSPKTENGVDEVDGLKLDPPIIFTEDANDVPDTNVVKDWKDESLSIFSPVRAETLQRIPPPKGSSGTWYQVGTKMIRETPTPLRTKCTCTLYKNKGWCPCKEQECRAYRRARGIPAWNGHFLESPNNISTTAVHSSVRPPPPTRYRETSV